MSRSINSALSTIFVLIASGALIGSLFLSGTIATVIYYGAEYGSPKILYILVFVLATVLSYAIGSSFTTIAAVGLPFVALAPAMDVSPAIVAAAAVCGAFTGDGLGRISDTFILTCTVVGTEPGPHQRALATVLAPGWVASAVLFVVLGLRDGGDDGLSLVDGRHGVGPPGQGLNQATMRGTGGQLVSWVVKLINSSSS